MRTIAGSLFACFLFVQTPAALADELRLVRSLSGPSGKVVGSKFVFDEVRSRFVYPQDQAFSIYFEWDTVPGDHVLTGTWRLPNGQVESISPDVKIETTTRELTCYWTYTLNAKTAPGVWTLEVRVDGAPAGSHSYEIAGTAVPTPPAGDASARALTLDQIFRAASRSMVSVRKLDGDGRRRDAAVGFVIASNRVATALQAIDGAANLELEFSDGRRVQTKQVVSYSVAGDWAILSTDTKDLPAIEAGDPAVARVGERLVAFNVEGGVKNIGGVHITGTRRDAALGERIQLSPTLDAEAAGGPLLDARGMAVAILGGSAIPGGRWDSRHMTVGPELGLLVRGVNAATPVSAAKTAPEHASTIEELLVAGVLTPALEDMEGLLLVDTAVDVPKTINGGVPRQVSEFSRKDKAVWVISEWQRKGKVSRGVVSAKVYDQQNRLRITVEARKLSLSTAPTRSAFTFSPAALGAGIYRIDLIWDDRAVWRTFIRVVE